MADLAVQWDNLEMWKRVVNASGAEQNVEVLGQKIFVDAWKKFSLRCGPINSPDFSRTMR